MTDELLPAERKVLDALGDQALDFRAMWAVSNLFRASAAIRRHMEANVDRVHGLVGPADMGRDGDP
jgi:MarR family transcriptional regulator, organic hydroperoxide resistance regulator